MINEYSFAKTPNISVVIWRLLFESFVNIRYMWTLVNSPAPPLITTTITTTTEQFIKIVVTRVIQLIWLAWW
jgi:hypothetical protein